MRLPRKLAMTPNTSHPSYEIILDSVVRKLLDVVVRLAENPHLESLVPETV